MFFGIAGSLYVYIPGNDGATHLLNIERFYSDMRLSEFFQKSWEILQFKSVSGATDIYIHTLSYLSGSVFEIPELLHVFAGLVLGYFYTKSALLLFRNKPMGRLGVITIALMALFLIYRSLTALNSIRMWTAMWVLFFGSYSWFITKKKKYLLVALLSVFFHFSYAIIILPLVVGYLLKKRKLIIVGIYIISFSFSLNFVTIEPYIPALPLLEQKIKYNLKTDNESAIEREKPKENFYKRWGEKVYGEYSIVGLSFILLLFYLKANADDKLIFLLTSGMILYTFSNIIDFSPSLSGRSQTVGSVYILAAAIYLVFTLSRYSLSRLQKTLFNAGLGSFLISSIPVVLFQISYILNTFSVFIILMPFASWILGDIDFTIREAVGMLF